MEKESNIEATKNGLVEVSSGRKIISPLDIIALCKKVKRDTLSLPLTMEIVGGPNKYDFSAQHKETVEMCDEIICHLSNLKDCSCS